MSIVIQRGDINKINAIIYPKGFNISASKNSPFIKEKMERVDPQEGQGIFVICLIKHPSYTPFEVWTIVKP
jgi:nucleoside diphosphate kinase